MTTPPQTTTRAPSPVDVASLTRVRAGVRAVLALGILASLAANVAHAESSVTGRLISAWSPIALALAVEIGSRVPLTRSLRAGIRWVATAAIAGIAAWVSYWHMVSVAERHGETPTSAHLVPLSVDGLVIVASVCLVEITDRVRHLSDPPVTQTTAHAAPPHPNITPPTSAPTSAGASAPTSAPRTADRSAPTSAPRTARGSAPRSAGGSAGRSAPRASANGSADDQTLRDLVAQARAERPRAGAPAVRRLLNDRGLSASDVRIRAALAATTTQPLTAPTTTPTTAPVVDLVAVEDDARQEVAV